ncbi:Uncharacterized protein APZ42_005658, partial [Daphnia magna]
SLRNKDCFIGYSHRKSLATASKLPTKSVVLARFKGIQDEKKGQHIDICREIFAELKVVWEKAGIPIKADNTCVNDIKNVHHSWKAILKIPVENRKKDFARDKIVSFKTSLNKLLDLSSKDVEQKLKASHNSNAAVDFKFLLA